MSRKVNKTNLRLALVSIEKGICFADGVVKLHAICEANHLGESTERKLRYALLDYKYERRNGDPSARIRIKRDGSWAYRFRSNDGGMVWGGLASEIESIMEAMDACPPEEANPYYYGKASKKTTSRRAKKDEVPAKAFLVKSNPLERFSTEDLLREIMRRCHEG